MRATQVRTVLEIRPRRLTRPFRYAHETIEAVDVVRLLLADGEAVLGEGEIAADAGYGQDGPAIVAQAARLAGALATDPDGPPLDRHDRHDRRGPAAGGAAGTGPAGWLRSRLAGAAGAITGPARMLVEMAFLDAAARAAGLPVWRLLGLPEPPRVRLLHTVPFGAPVPERLRPVKVKLGGPDDAAVLRRLVGVRGPVLLDPNRGWSAADWAALRPLVRAVAPAVLEDPVADPALLPRIRAALPGTAVILDEGVDTARDVARAARLADGANLKATRVGGLLSTMDALDLLTRRGATRMLGCFLEPPRTIAYLAQLAGRCDWTDLDGHFWLSDHPPAMSYALDSSRPGIPRIAY